MRLFEFQHGPPVKAGCCNWRTSATYWLAESREAAEKEIREHTEAGEPHGLCANCMVGVLASDEYEIARVSEA